jgi:hypothetical protein
MASLMHEAYASCRKVCVTLFKLWFSVFDTSTPKRLERLLTVVQSWFALVKSKLDILYEHLIVENLYFGFRVGEK